METGRQAAVSSWLEVELSLAGTEVQAAVRGHQGQSSRPRSLGPRFTLESLRQLGRRLREAAESTDSLHQVMQEAQELYQSLFQGEVLELLHQLRGAAGGEPLLLRVLPHGAELQEFSWEVLCQPGTQVGFLGTSQREYVARGVHSLRGWQPRPVKGAVRLLVISPSDAQAPARLRGVLQESIQQGEIEWLDPLVGALASTRVLFDRLRREPVPHILHFIGHGRLDESGAPELRLADQDGEESWCKVELLANELEAAFRGELRLVFLEACQGAQPGKLASAAEWLARAGADAVMAHLWPVKADVARLSSATFYRSLTGAAEQRGDVGRSLHDARRTVLGVHPKSGEAFSPVLYLRGHDSTLFDFQGRKVGPPPAAAPAGPQPGSILVSGISEPPANASPAVLLNARHQFVPFMESGLEELLTELKAWCEEGDPVRARLFVGEGGTGKTRLFIEWCKRLNETEEWKAGFLVRGADPEGLERLVSSFKQVLVVVDYAESRLSLGALLERAAQLRNSGHGGRLRLVLLARNADDWWRELLRSDGPVKDLLSEKVPMEMARFAPGEAERQEMFRRVARRFAERKNPAAPEPPIPSLNDPRFERVLYVHMAALATVEGLRFTATSLQGEILDHEERFWINWLRSRGKGANEQRFIKRARRAVTALTLRGGSSESEEETEEFIVGVCGKDDVSVLLSLLRYLYPGEAREAGSAYVSGLEPDLLGEAMVLRTLTEPGATARKLLDHVFKEGSERALRTGFAVLGRISEEHPDKVWPWIEHVLAENLEVRALAAFEAAKAVGLRTAHASLGTQLAAVLRKRGTLNLATLIREAGLPEDTVSLREVAAWTFEILLQNLRQGDSPELLAARAFLCLNLGAWLGKLGKPEQALESTQMAVEHYRSLSRLDPEAFLPELAGGLSNLGAFLNTLGREDEAVAAVQEAVAHQRTLVEKNPESYLARLANSLNSLGSFQASLSQPEAALAAVQESVTHFRKLAQARPNDFLPGLAMSLVNLTAAQGNLENHEDAIESAKESVAIYRKLAQAHPDAFLPELALSLDALGAAQSRSGRAAEAIQSTEEAAGHWRTLARARPDVFGLDLARCLHNLCVSQRGRGAHQEALMAAQEALEVIWPLFMKLPQVARSLTDMLLKGMIVLLSEMGQLPTRELLEKVRVFQETQA